MKKILFLIDNLKGGGAEKAIKIIIEGLNEKKHAPVIILLEDQKDYVIDKSIETYSLSKNISKIKFLFLLFKLITLLKRINPDIIYATNTKAQMLSLLTKPFFNSNRIINIQVDLTKQYEKREYIFNYFCKLLKLSDGYSFISQGIYENLKGKIPEKKHFFIPNPIDFFEIDTLKIEEIENDIKHVFDKKTIINIGRLTQQKGQWILLEAFAKLSSDYHLVILGTGEKERELKQLSETLGISERVFFLGFQKNPFKYLYRADLFVLSSLWEGFGNVIIEAMRCGLPVISTDCPSGPREILAPDTTASIPNYSLEEYGILTAVNDVESLTSAIELIMKNEELYNNYKQQSLSRANSFEKEKIVTLFEETLCAE